MTLTCTECGLELKMGKEVWFMEGYNYHPECVKDNKTLYIKWKLKNKGC
jgi:hypothetical protein